MQESVWMILGQIVSNFSDFVKGQESGRGNIFNVD